MEWIVGQYESIKSDLAIFFNSLYYSGYWYIDTIIEKYAVFIGMFLCFLFAITATWLTNRDNALGNDKRGCLKGTLGLFVLFTILTFLFYTPVRDKKVVKKVGNLRYFLYLYS